MLEHIKAIRDKNELNGTLYYEFCLGKFTGNFWSDGSLFIPELGFDLVLGIFEKHIHNFQPYGNTDVPKSIWNNIISDLKITLKAIDFTTNHIELGKIVRLYDYEIDCKNIIYLGEYEMDLINEFEKIKQLISEMIKEIIVWYEENKDNYSTFSILGI